MKEDTMNTMSKAKISHWGKSILTTSIAFVLFGFAFTLSSCEQCSKDEDGDTNGKSKTTSSGDNVAILDVGTEIGELEATVFRVAELVEKAKQEEQKAKNAAKRVWDAMLAKVVADMSDENRVEETRKEQTKANRAEERARAYKSYGGGIG
jgi:hypothetical protein